MSGEAKPIKFRVIHESLPKCGEWTSKHGWTTNPNIVTAIRARRAALRQSASENDTPTDHNSPAYRHDYLARYGGYPEMLALARSRHIGSLPDTPLYRERFLRPLNGDHIEQWVRELLARLVPKWPPHKQNPAMGIYSSPWFPNGPCPDELACLEIHTPNSEAGDSRRSLGLYRSRINIRDMKQLSRLGIYLEDSSRYDPTIESEVPVKVIRTIEDGAFSKFLHLAPQRVSAEKLVIDPSDDREGVQVASLLEFIDEAVKWFDPPYVPGNTWIAEWEKVG